MSVGLPKYSTPAKDLREADATASELEGLTGEARQRQQNQVNELVRIANRQNEELLRGNPERVGSSKIVHLAMGNPEKSAGAASSPHGGPRREEVVTSARRNKQIVLYDPTRAGKEKEMRKNDDRRSVSRGEAGRGNHDQGNAGQGNATNGNAGQQNSTGAGQPQQRNIPRQEQSAGRGMQ